MDPKDINSDDRKKRLKELSKLSRPHKGTVQREETDKLMNRAWASPAMRERAKEMHKRLLPRFWRSKNQEQGTVLVF